nr:hypothetical protein [Providencia stuartii]
MLCPGWPDVRQPPETGIGREDELLRYKSRWGASVRHPIERLPGDTSPILVCVVALLGAELEFGEGAHCLRRKDDLCDAGNVVLGAGGVPLGWTRTYLRRARTYLSGRDRVGRWCGHHPHYLFRFYTPSFVRIPQLFQAAYLLKSKASNAGTQNSHWATVLLPKRNWNDIERNHESNQ